MTIEEVRAHKELYARKIQDLVEQFHNETGVLIMDIGLRYVDVTRMGSKVQEEQVLHQVLLRLDSI
jgi:hypothetical protein